MKPVIIKTGNNNLGNVLGFVGQFSMLNNCCRMNLTQHPIPVFHLVIKMLTKTAPSLFHFSLIPIFSLLLGAASSPGQTTTNALPRSTEHSVNESAEDKTKTVIQTAEIASQDKPGSSATDPSQSAVSKKTDMAQFMRIRKDERDRPLAMETSITRYEKTDENGRRVVVDLIGVVHIGEQQYYEELNKLFEQYDGLLYELVAPEGTVIPKGGRESQNVGANPVAAIQVGMQNALGLQFQLDHIDYTKPNFIHADMTPEEYAESMKENDESIGGYALKAIGSSMAMQAAGQGDSSMGMLFSVFSSNRELKLRRNFAKQMMKMEGGLVMFEGKDGSTIIDYRNAKCMKVLQREIEAGKQNLAIFYGAGHLPDMHDRLINDFGMKQAGRSWLIAWNLQSQPE